MSIFQGTTSHGTTSSVSNATHCSENLVFVVVSIKSKYLVSSGVVQHSTKSCVLTRYNECMDQVLDELKTTFEVGQTHASRGINNKTKVKFCFAY